PIFSKFIGSEISDKSLERLRKKRNFAISVDKSPVLLITVGRNGHKTKTGYSSTFLFVSLQIYIFILDIYFFFCSLAED
ncbi:hypothetical protein, partial [Bacteroides congonensis]